MFIENNKTNKQTKQARNGEKRKKEDKKRMIKKSHPFSAHTGS